MQYWLPKRVLYIIIFKIYIIVSCYYFHILDEEIKAQWE